MDIDDGTLCAAVARIQLGLFDADLGHGVFKQRVARKGEGKSGGFRTIVVLKVFQAAFFIHGFRKSDAANVSLGELVQLKKLSAVLLTLSAEDLALELSHGYLIEVNCDGEAVP